MQLHGSLDSFWIGSILVIVLTGIYTVLGGMRAVAYTEALQIADPRASGSALVTWYGLKALGGWDVLREVAGTEMFNLWRPIVPEGMNATWAPVKEARPHGLVLQRQLPVDRDAVLRARSSGCGTGAPTSTSSSARSVLPGSRKHDGDRFSPPV